MRLLNIIPVSFLIASLAITGCYSPGPPSIITERPNYNDVIQQTSRDQVFYNIIRVYNNDIPQFVDVTSINAQMTFEGTVTGAAMLPQGQAGGGGATALTEGGTSSGQTVMTTNVPYLPGHDFSLTGSVEVAEMPTITYQPLQGQPLIEQISTPVTVDSLVNLYDSDRDISALLTLAVDRLTDQGTDYFSAMNAITDLDSMGAIRLDAESSTDHGGGSSSTQNTSGGSSTPKNDTLVLYFDPQHVFWNAPGFVFPGIIGNCASPAKSGAKKDAELNAQISRQPPPADYGDAVEEEAEEKDAEMTAQDLWNRLTRIYAHEWNSSEPDRIPLCTVAVASGGNSPSSGPSAANTSQTTTLNVNAGLGIQIGASMANAPQDKGKKMPTIRTRSADGILRAFAHPWFIMEVLTPDEYDRFVRPEILFVKENDHSFYHFDPNLLESYRNFRHLPSQNPTDFDSFANTDPFLKWETSTSDCSVKNTLRQIFTDRSWNCKSLNPQETAYYKGLVETDSGETGLGVDFAKKFDGKQAMQPQIISFATNAASASKLINLCHPHLILLNDTILDDSKCVKDEASNANISVVDVSNLMTKPGPRGILLVDTKSMDAIIADDLGKLGIDVLSATTANDAILTIQTPSNQTQSNNIDLVLVSKDVNDSDWNKIADAAKQAGVLVTKLDLNISEFAQPKQILFVSPTKPQNVDSFQYRLGQEIAGDSRHYLIVVHSDDPKAQRKARLSNPYVFYAYPGDNYDYWIDKDDFVSRQNFALVSEFLTIQAAPPTQNGPSQTIGVGGAGH